MRRTKILSTASLLAMMAGLLAAPALLHAQAIASLPGLSPSAEPRLGRYVELVVDDTGTGLAAGVFDFPVNPAVTTIVLFPEDVQHGAGVPAPYFDVAIDARRVAISPNKRRTRAGIQRNVTLFSDSLSVGLVLKPTETPSEAIALAVVRPRSQVERWQADYAKYVATRGDREEQEHGDRAVLDYILNMRPTPIQPKTVLGDVAPRAIGATDVIISNVQAVWSKPNEMVLKFDMENTGAVPFEWTGAQAYGEDSEANHARAARLRMPVEPAEGLVGRLSPGQRAQAAIIIERFKEISGPMTIVLHEHGGDRQVKAIMDHWMPLQTRHTVQHMELRPVEPPDPERGKVSLHLQGVYGAIWLGDGTGLEQSDATSLTGLGVRAQYAFNRYWAVEGEAMGASTGEARFEGVTYAGEQGDLTRNASLGRVQFGGVLRLGEQIVPILRLGVGLQGARHSGTLTTATGEAPGPDAFEWSRLFTFGTGLDVRLGAFVAGFAVSVVGEAQIDSIEAGIHLGYGWKP